MSRKTICAVLLLALALASPAVRAQDEEEPVRQFVYSTYFNCGTNDQGLADMLFEAVQAPVYEAAVEDGTISAYGWLAHHTGGQWRRANYFVAPTVKELLAAQQTIQGRIAEAGNPQAAAQFSKACPTHDDYIWRSVTGSAGEGGIAVAKSGEVGISQYMVCKMSKQQRVDELVKTVFAPVYDAKVEAGALSGWGWLEHQVGGEYRRLFTMRGADADAVLEAWGDAINQMAENHEAEMTEFNEICYTHQDYIWNIVHRK
jgi:hypothetical protein